MQLNTPILIHNIQIQSSLEILSTVPSDSGAFKPSSYIQSHHTVCLVVLN